MSSLENLIHAYTKNLDSYLKIETGNIYTIPFSQRKYEWRKQEVSRLFKDLTSLYETTVKKCICLTFLHFLRMIMGILEYLMVSKEL